LSIKILEKGYKMKRLKLSLVVPNYRWNNDDPHTFWTYLPYGYTLLAAMVEDICEVEIIDSYIEDMSQNELTKILAENKPDIIGITCLMDAHGNTGHEVAKIAKEVLPNVTTIYGGVYVTMNSQLASKDPNIDYLVVGEGEFVLRNLIEFFMGKSDRPTKGIIYRNENDVLINKGRADFIPNLDVLPRPAYHLVPFEKYSSFLPREKTIGTPPKLPYVRMLTSRGCPYECSFCQVEEITGHKFRAKSAEAVLDEIEWLRDEWGVKSLVFADDNFFLNMKRVKQIFEGFIKRGIKMPWIAEDASVWTFNREMLELLAKTGCEYLGFAIESGTERVLKDIVQGKPINFQQTKEVIDICKELGIYTSANYIIGFPTETWEEIRETLRMAEWLDSDYTRIFAAIPLKNTKLWDLTEAAGAFKEGYDHFGGASSWSTGQIETSEFSADDLTLLRAYEWDRINFISKDKREKTAKIIGITEDELKEVRRKTLAEAITKLNRKYQGYNYDGFVHQ
jgi:anaerobic magnesium-protoporphyrin IX monomethyl ester cyclase